MQISGADVKRPHNHQDREMWQRAAIELTSTYRKQYGMEIGQCKMVMHVSPCEGLVRQVDNTVEKRFAPTSIIFPVQV